MNPNQLLDNETDDIDAMIAKLAVLGSSLSFIGDGISTLSAILALIQIQSEEKSNQDDPNNETVTQQQFDSLQQELNQLKKELEQMKVLKNL